MVEMEEEQMSQVSGTGLAFVFDDFSFRMAPTSYVELTGENPTAPAAAAGWKWGAPRYYGISMTSGSTAGTDWFASDAGGSGCDTSGVGGNLACPMGVGSGDYGVEAFASVYDPFILRVFEYEGYNYSGLWLDQPAGTGGATDMPTVLEFRGPSNSDTWRWSFWGELEIDRPNNSALDGAVNNSVSSGGADFLQSQSIILGKPVAEGLIWDSANDTYSVNPNGPRRAVQRWMYTTNSADQTFGVTYDSALSGDFRFSVRQKAGSPDQLHYVPDFDDNEGLYFRNVDAFIPLGTLHYQALTFSGVSEYDLSGNKVAPTQNGNFSIELTQIPNTPNVYNHFYCGNQGVDCDLDASGAILLPNPDTHGYVRWGDWSGVDIGAGTGLPGPNATNNGIYFADGPNTTDVTNLGVARIEGMLIQHMKITSLGAAP